MQHCCDATHLLEHGRVLVLVEIAKIGTESSAREGIELLQFICSQLTRDTDATFVIMAAADAQTSTACENPR